MLFCKVKSVHRHYVTLLVETALGYNLLNYFPSTDLALVNNIYINYPRGTSSLQLLHKQQLSSHLVETLGSPSQFTYICAGLSPPLNVESNRSWCWQLLLSTLGGGTATSVPTNVTTIVQGGLAAGSGPEVL